MSVVKMLTRVGQGWSSIQFKGSCQMQRGGRGSISMVRFPQKVEISGSFIVFLGDLR